MIYFDLMWPHLFWSNVDRYSLLIISSSVLMKWSLQHSESNRLLPTRHRMLVGLNNVVIELSIEIPTAAAVAIVVVTGSKPCTPGPDIAITTKQRRQAKHSMGPKVAMSVLYCPVGLAYTYYSISKERYKYKQISPEPVHCRHHARPRRPGIWVQTQDAQS